MSTDRTLPDRHPRRPTSLCTTCCRRLRPAQGSRSAVQHLAQPPRRRLHQPDVAPRALLRGARNRRLRGRRRLVRAAAEPTAVRRRRRRDKTPARTETSAPERYQPISAHPQASSSPPAREHSHGLPIPRTECLPAEDSPQMAGINRHCNEYGAAARQGRAAAGTAGCSCTGTPIGRWASNPARSGSTPTSSRSGACCSTRGMRGSSARAPGTSSWSRRMRHRSIPEMLPEGFESSPTGPCTSCSTTSSQQGSPARVLYPEAELIGAEAARGAVRAQRDPLDRPGRLSRVRAAARRAGARARAAAAGPRRPRGRARHETTATSAARSTRPSRPSTSTPTSATRGRGWCRTTAFQHRAHARVRVRRGGRDLRGAGRLVLLPAAAVPGRDRSGGSCSSTGPRSTSS